MEVRGPRIAALVVACATAACQLLLDTSRDDVAPGADAAPSDASAIDATTDADVDAFADASTVETIASGLVSPASLVVDDTFAYWLESGASGRLLRCPVVGCQAPEVLAAAEDHPFSLIGHVNGVLVWTLPTMLRGWFPGADGGEVKDVLGLNGGLWVTSGAATLYAAYKEAEGAHAVTSCIVGGACGGGNILIRYEPSVIAQLRATSVALAWVLDTTKLRACTLGSCIAGTRDVVADPDGISTFAGDDQSFYVARAGAAGGIYAVPVGGLGSGTPVVLADGLLGVPSLVVDGRSLFVADQRGGRILELSTFGGTLREIASVPGSAPASLAVRRDYVYWIDDHAVRRVRRPR